MDWAKTHVIPGQNPEYAICTMTLQASSVQSICSLYAWLMQPISGSISETDLKRAIVCFSFDIGKPHVYGPYTNAETLCPMLWDV